MKGIIKDFILNSIAAGVLCHRRLRMKIYPPCRNLFSKFD